MNGKSIGFLPVKTRRTEEKEAQKLGVPAGTRIIEEWLLLEYACTFLPANQEAVVEAVSKGGIDLPPELAKALGLDPALLKPPQPQDGRGSVGVVGFLTLAEAEAAIKRRLQVFDIGKLVADRLDVARGRV